MGLFDIFKRKSEESKFVNENSFSNNLVNQVKMAPQTIAQLRGLGVDENKKLKLEYFFYTNTQAKAESLTNELVKLGYTALNDNSAGDKNLFVITGWTSQIVMSEDVVKNWIKQMCELSYKFDSEFDGWGTTPNQE